MKIFGGPCILHDRNSAIITATFLKDKADLFRAKIRGGGTHGDKAYWGINLVGLDILKEINEDIMPVIVEVRNKEQVNWVSEYGIRNIWVASRSMQDYPLLQYIDEKGDFDNIYLKNGLGNTVDEIHGALKYFKNKKCGVILRGNVHFDRTETTRWRPDMLAIPQLKELGDIEVIFDPSHSTGERKYVIPMAKSALAAGADGIMVEVLEDPTESRGDFRQLLDFDSYNKLIGEINEGT